MGQVAADDTYIFMSCTARTTTTDGAFSTVLPSNQPLSPSLSLSLSFSFTLSLLFVRTLSLSPRFALPFLFPSVLRLGVSRSARRESSARATNPLVPSARKRDQGRKAGSQPSKPGRQAEARVPLAFASPVWIANQDAKVRIPSTRRSQRRCR